MFLTFSKKQEQRRVVFETILSPCLTNNRINIMGEGEVQQTGKGNIAYMYALVGNVIMATMHILIKQASGVLSPFQVLYIRSIFLIVVSWKAVKQQGQSHYIQGPILFRKVMARMVMMGLGNIVLFYCLKYLPVSTAITMYNLGPLFIFFIEALYFKKKIKGIGLALALLSFMGITLIVQPEFLFGSKEGGSFYVEGFEWYIGLMLMGAFSNAFNMLLIHIIGKELQPIVTLHQSNVGYLFASSILCSFLPHQVSAQDLSWELALVLLGIVCTGFFAQLFIIRANSLARPSLVMPFGYASVAMGFLADVLLFGTEFTLLAVLGIGFTSAGLLGSFLSEKLEQKKSEGVTP